MFDAIDERGHALLLASLMDRHLNPTAENIAVVIWHKLRPHIDAKNDLEVKLYETPRNFVTFNG